MAVTLRLVESTTTLGQEVVTVTVVASATPGPAGPGVPTGGTDGQVLTKASATDYDTAWEDPTGGGGGAPTDADYLVGTANGTLSNEIVVGTTPGGELGGTWASPTVDATHSGSSHAAVQAAAEATAAAALSSHEADTTSVHGIADTSALLDTSDIGVSVQAFDADLSTYAGITPSANVQSVLGAADYAAIRTLLGLVIGTNVQAFDADLTTYAGITPSANVQALLGAANYAAMRVLLDLEAGTDFPSQATFDDHSARHENGGADEISLAGLDGTPNALQTHLDDVTDAHDASAISVLDVAGDYTATDVEGVLAEIAPQLGAGSVDPSDEDLILHMRSFA